MVKKLEIPRDPLSNTKSSLTRVKKDTKGLNSQGSQLTSWFFTYNNYTEACIPLIEKRFKEICSKYIFERSRQMWNASFTRYDLSQKKG